MFKPKSFNNDNSLYMKRLAIILSIFSGAVLPLGNLVAQGGLQTGEVDIIKQFNARLADADRFLFAPQLPPLDTFAKKQTYAIANRPLNVQYLPPRILPKTLQNEPKDPIYNGYARLGAGFPKALLVEGAYDLVNKEGLDVGFDLRHLSMNNESKVENQRFSDNDFGLHAGFHSDQGFSVSGNLNYSRDFLYFYGYTDLDDDFASELTYDAEDVKQRFSLFSGNVKLYNNQRTAGGIDYSASLDFYTMEDLYASREGGIDLVLKGTKWFEDRHPLTIQLETDFSGYRDSTKQSLNNFFLTPSYSYHGDRFRVKLGLNLANFDDEFSFYPILEASLNVVDNLVTAFAGTEGGLQKNNFRALTEYNPFLTSRPKLKNTFYSHYYGGIKGEYRGVQYRAQVGYKDVKNLALFLTNGDSIPRFNVLYDTGGIFSITAELRTQLIEGLELNGRFTQNFFSLDREEKPWHLPSLTLNVGAAYSGIIDNLTFKSELFFQNGVPTLAFDGKPKNLNTLLDLNLGADYQFSDNIGAFVQVNNVLNNRYQRWQHYPMIGLTAIAGLTARF